MVIFLFLRNMSRDGHPEPGAADVHRRHVRGHVPAGLQPRQPLADGAHAGRRLRGGRRHRGAGEHRPAHREGRAGARGGPQGQPGDRLHRRLDDDLAGGGVHPGALHGRASSAGCSTSSRSPSAWRSWCPASSRSRSRRCCAAACSSRTTPRSGTAGSTRRSSGPAVGSLAWYERTLSWVMDHRPADAGVQRADPGRHRRACSAIVPKGFIPTEDTASSSPRPRRPKGPASTRWWSTSSAAAAIVAEDPNVDGFMSAVGGGGQSRTTNQGRLFMHLKTARSGRMSADEIVGALALGKLAAVPGMRGLRPESAGAPHRRAQLARASTSSRCRAPTSTRCTTGRRPWSAGCTSCPASPTSPATCRSRTRRSRWTSTATARPRSASTANQIESALYNAYGARQVSTIYTPNDQYWVMMELLPQYQRDLSALSLLNLTGREGELGAARAVWRRSRSPPGRSP